jgi:hypothetical protein
LAFHPYPHLIQAFFNTPWFGPPRHLTAASSWTWVDHPASRLPQVTIFALFRLAFASVTSLKDLALLPTSNSLAHYAKGTLSSGKAGLQLIVGNWFQVLFHSPPGVLFTFPSRYYSTIGYRVVFSLTPWSGRIPTGFLVSRSTRVCIQWSLSYFAYGPVTLSGRTFQYIRLYHRFLTPRQTCKSAQIHPTTPGAQRLQTYTCYQV